MPAHSNSITEKELKHEENDYNHRYSYKRPTTVGQQLTNHKHLLLNKTKNKPKFCQDVARTVCLVVAMEIKKLIVPNFSHIQAKSKLHRCIESDMNKLQHLCGDFCIMQDCVGQTLNKFS